MKATIKDCLFINLPFVDGESITEINNSKEIPIEIKRVFYLYDIPNGESRGGHAHKACHQFFVAISGSFDVLLDDGVNKEWVTLNDPNVGLHVPPGIWDSEANFSSDAICLVLASHTYHEEDYIRNYDNYLAYQSAQ